MKRFICLVLCAAMLSVSLPLCATAEEAGESPLCFAVASDLHYDIPSGELERYTDDPVFGYANRRAAMENESGFIIDAFLEQCAADESIRYVLIPGDLADDGRTMPEAHLTVAEKLRRFEEETGKSVFVINGNHDASKAPETSYADFKRIYADFGYDLALETREDDCSYTADLGEKYRLIALDSNDPDDSTADGMTLSKLNWVRKQAEKAYADGRNPILMMHHNLLDHLPAQRIISRDFIVRFHFSTAAFFADLGIKIVLTGHEHCSDVSVYTSPAGNTVYDFATTSLTMYPLSYRIFTLTDEEIKYESASVGKIDTAALASAVDGYTDEQLELMNADLGSYAEEFLKKGIEYRLALSLTMEKMGISGDDFFYPLVSTAVGGLTDILEMPLYGENSVSALASEYGMELPVTKYKNGWELATGLVAEHYAGGENYELDSPEITLLLRLVALVLRTDLPTVNDEVFMSAATALLEKNGYSGISGELTRLCCGVFGSVKPCEYFAVALVSPLLYEFAFDADGVDDNTGVIAGYGVKENGKSIFSGFSLAANRLTQYIKWFMFFFVKIFTR